MLTKQAPKLFTHKCLARALPASNDQRSTGLLGGLLKNLGPPRYDPLEVLLVLLGNVVPNVSQE
jgi:hypothetical protein